MKAKLHSKLMLKAYRVENWITDRYERWPKPVREWWDKTDDGTFARLLCGVLGHEAEKDHCGIPEHDCCSWCHERMPFQAGDVPERLLRRLHWYLDSPTLSKMVNEKLGENGLNLRQRGHG